MDGPVKNNPKIVATGRARKIIQLRFHRKSTRTEIEHASAKIAPRDWVSPITSVRKMDDTKLNRRLPVSSEFQAKIGREMIAGNKITRLPARTLGCMVSDTICGRYWYMESGRKTSLSKIHSVLSSP